MLKNLKGAVRALDGFPRLPWFFVKMMGGRIVYFRPVALQAKRIALLDPSRAVHIVAVAAADIPIVHLALHEGPVNIYFFQNLSVGEIHPLGKQLRDGVIQKIIEIVGVVTHGRAPGMAGRAEFDLLTGTHAGCFNDQFEIGRIRPGHIRQLGPGHMP